MSVRIRAATPKDAPFLARVTLIASRSHLKQGAWDLWIEDEATRLRFLERLLLTPFLSWCHYSGFLVAEVDGEPAAGLSAYVEGAPGMVSPNEAIPTVAKEIGLSDDDVATGISRLVPFLSCVPEPIGDPWVVEWVATLPDYRRRGLVQRLLDEILEKGRRSGHRRAQVSFFVGNTPAQRAYERVGFKYVDERRSDELERTIGTPGMIRTMREL